MPQDLWPQKVAKVFFRPVLIFRAPIGATQTEIANQITL